MAVERRLAIAGINADCVRMPHPVKSAETRRPFDVALLRPRRVMSDPRRMANPVQQPGRLREHERLARQLQHLYVEKRQRFMGRLQCPWRVLLAPNEMLEEFRRCGDIEFARMAFAVKEDEPPHPFHMPVGRLASAEMKNGCLPKLVEQSRWLDGNV
jgi:hypothetical protein